jgi:hypothetical protein
MITTAGGLGAAASRRIDAAEFKLSATLEA